MKNQIHSDTVARELHRLADLLDADAKRLDAMYRHTEAMSDAERELRERSEYLRRMAEALYALDTYLA